MLAQKRYYAGSLIMENILRWYSIPLLRWMRPFQYMNERELFRCSSIMKSRCTSLRGENSRFSALKQVTGPGQTHVSVEVIEECMVGWKNIFLICDTSFTLGNRVSARSNVLVSHIIPHNVELVCVAHCTDSTGVRLHKQVVYAGSSRKRMAPPGFVASFGFEKLPNKQMSEAKNT